MYVLFFFFKQKTAYEMRISDWSSDVCSSDLIAGASTTFSADVPQIFVDVDRTRAETLGLSVGQIYDALGAHFGSRYVNDFTLEGRVFQVNQIGRASCRERVCQYV